MESLPLDIQIKLLTELSGKEIQKLCKTSSYMRKFCQDPRYNRLWQRKIKDDYNVIYRGGNAYYRYGVMTYVTGKTFYLVHDCLGDKLLFMDKNDAINYLVTIAATEFQVPSGYAAERLKNGERIDMGDGDYIHIEEITVSSIDHTSNSYEKSLHELVKDLGLESGAIEIFFKYFSVFGQYKNPPDIQPEQIDTVLEKLSKALGFEKDSPQWDKIGNFIVDKFMYH